MIPSASLVRSLRRLVCALALVAGWAHAQPTVTDLFLQRAEQRVREYVQGYDGAVGVAFIDLTTGRGHAVNGDVSFPQASSIKIPIMLRVFQAAQEGVLKLSDPVPFTPADLVGGSGNLRKAIAAGRWSSADRRRDRDDRTQRQQRDEQVHRARGMDRVNRMLDENGLRAHAAAARDDGRQRRQRGWENISTPNEMAEMARQLWQGRLVDQASCRQMLEILKKVKGPMREAVPPGDRDRHEDGRHAGRELPERHRAAAGPAVCAERDVDLQPGREATNHGHHADCLPRPSRCSRAPTSGATRGARRRSRSDCGRPSMRFLF